jgi:hypothetical protein
MTDPWWMTYEDRSPITYPDRRSGRTARVALTTDPKLTPTKHGQLKLTLVNRHPHEAVRIYTGRICG